MANPKSDKGFVYQEFGNGSSPALERAVERGIQDLPPNQQNVRIQATRAGRKGKTVTVITGFQTKPETLATLLPTFRTSFCSTDTSVISNRNSSNINT